MSLLEIKAYKCEWCGAVLQTNQTYHEIDCRYDPKARTCISCLYSKELKNNTDIDACYCPRNDRVFKFPHEKYCPDYKQDPNFISYRKN